MLNKQVFQLLLINYMFQLPVYFSGLSPELVAARQHLSYLKEPETRLQYCRCGLASVKKMRILNSYGLLSTLLTNTIWCALG